MNGLQIPFTFLSKSFLDVLTVSSVHTIEKSFVALPIKVRALAMELSSRRESPTVSASAKAKKGARLSIHFLSFQRNGSAY